MTRGIHWDRTRAAKGPTSDRERAFAEEWADDGEGVLSILLDVTNGGWRQINEPGAPSLGLSDLLKNPGPNERDRVVAATVVQWLGTNVGFSFLVAALLHARYKIVDLAERDLRIEDLDREVESLRAELASTRREAALGAISLARFISEEEEG